MNKNVKRVLITILSIVIIFLIGFLIWAGDYYHADEEVVAKYQVDDDIDRNGKYTIINPDEPNNTGIIFYPGGKVEAVAYLPLLDKLSQQGYTIILCEMPLNLAFLGMNRADAAIELFSEDIEEIYIGGHSLGSAMASAYAVDNIDKVDGVIILGGYIYGGYPAEDALTIYGSLNSQESKIDYTENIVVIEGGNHAQFGNYGEQAGDLRAEISREEQQNLTIEAIVDFIESR